MNVIGRAAAAAGLVLLLAPAVVPAGRAAAAAHPHFMTELVQANGSGEPSAVNDPKSDWTYADAPESSTVVWRKHGNQAWLPGVATQGSSGDSDVAVDADGALYASDLVDNSGSNAVSVSLDHGASFAYKNVVIPHGGPGLIDSSGGLWDRQWLAAWGHGQVVSTAGYFASLLDTTEIEHAWVSGNRGRTYEGPFTVTPPVEIAGKLTRAQDGHLYLPYHASSGIGVAVSADGGRAWRQHLVAAGVQTDGFPSVAVDDAGAVYMTWVATALNIQASTFGLSIHGVVQVARSTDHGGTWTKPVVVSDAGRTAVFPWIVAGAHGRAAVVYYAARAPGVDAGPDVGTPVTKWDIEIAETQDALSDPAVWARSVAVSAVHTGSVCTQGLGCLSPEAVGALNLPLPFDRRLLDFFGATVRPDGRVMFVYPTDRPPSNVGDIAFAGVDIRSATQTAGPLLR